MFIRNARVDLWNHMEPSLPKHMLPRPHTHTHFIVAFDFELEIELQQVSRLGTQLPFCSRKASCHLWRYSINTFRMVVYEMLKG